ncbi:hypothetical protein NQ317_011845 [Molorchus minor]|uniref:Uncharacterized protein n=1 Tax=Molorchus minor TaxID=1323400 RepID=A0ABQ9JLV2_9CUCU|nr:hypothetical protein NQ317_011845 [Molorchus minor]
MVDQKSRNSLSLGMMQNLLDNINKDMDNKDLRVIIITAQGPIFLLGIILKNYKWSKIFRSNFGIFCSTPGIPQPRKGLKATILHMLLTGLPITASEAKASGLVSKVCAPENLESEVKTTTSAIISRADL